MVIRAKILNGEVYALTPEDDAKLKQAFPDGRIVLTSENCPELAAKIDELSAKLLVEKRDLYRRLANAD